MRALTNDKLMDSKLFAFCKGMATIELNKTKNHNQLEPNGLNEKNERNGQREEERIAIERGRERIVND